MDTADNFRYFASCDCGGKLVRIRRRLWQRLLYSAVYRCTDCGQSRVRQNPKVLFSPDSLCPRCGTTRLRILKRRDPVDTMSSSLRSTVQKILGAELHHCDGCRLQFYDFRKVAGKKSA